VRVVRSPDIGVIGVGEGTTQLFPKYFFDQLRLKPAQFYAELKPTWKLGIRFIWGPRRYFHYTFSQMIDSRLPDLPKNHGFYCEDDLTAIDLWSALMEHDKALPRDSAGRPHFSNHAHLGFHVENHRLVTYLEARCRDFGVAITDGTVLEVEKDAAGRSGRISPTSGERVEGDLYVDASGFRSELMGRALGTPFRDYTDTLFCDRAVIGGWGPNDRDAPAVHHRGDHGCGCGPGRSSTNTSSTAATFTLRDSSATTPRWPSFLAKPAGHTTPRVVKFRTGRYERMWRGNVVAIGNASGLCGAVGSIGAAGGSSTNPGLWAISWSIVSARPLPLQSRFTIDSSGSIGTTCAISSASTIVFNTRLETPFWQTARAETALHDAAPIVEYYRENGPQRSREVGSVQPKQPLWSGRAIWRCWSAKRCRMRSRTSRVPAELKRWREHLKDVETAAKRAFGAPQALEVIRRPAWNWN
jgi:tryptophan halogenase